MLMIHCRGSTFTTAAIRAYLGESSFFTSALINILFLSQRLHLSPAPRWFPPYSTSPDCSTFTSLLLHSPLNHLYLVLHLDLLLSWHTHSTTPTPVGPLLESDKLNEGLFLVTLTWLRQVISFVCSPAESCLWFTLSTKALVTNDWASHVCGDNLQTYSANWSTAVPGEGRLLWM